MKTKITDIFKNEKGEIINLLFEPVNSVAVITSKKGSIRSNHYHLTDSHYLYVLSGLVVYSERDIDGSNKTSVIVKPGEMFYSAPMKVHKVEFLEDSVLISMAKNIRDHEHHEQDLVRMEY